MLPSVSVQFKIVIFVTLGSASTIIVVTDLLKCVIFIQSLNYLLNNDTSSAVCLLNAGIARLL